MERVNIKYQILYLIFIAVIGILFFYQVNKRQREKFEKAPKINKELRLEDLSVKKISFERNGLYLNGNQYNSGGISWYSKVHDQDTTFVLGDIEPPFLLRKRENSDTLRIINDKTEYYLLVTD